jgi:tellurite resistance protein TerC
MTVAGVGSPLLWAGFTLFILAMLALDMGLLQRRRREVSTRAALLWSAVWIGLALAFNAGIYACFGPQKALEFLTGYLIEKALSIDNIFVFLVIFSYFRVPLDCQQRVLLWGVLGALVMRGLFILAGAALLHAFHWILYLFGGFLLLTGVRLATQRSDEVHPERNPLVRFFQRLLPTAPGYHESCFLVRQQPRGRWQATPLLMVLLVIESTDLVFALDSIPAIFAVTRDPFIVFTSNIFAILGLRALYFLLAGVIEKFHYLKVGLGLVLAFVGIKMLVAEFYPIPIGVSLGVIALLLGGSIVASLLTAPTPGPRAAISEEA